jgi:hypothetical protein
MVAAVIPPFAKLQTEDPLLDRVQDRIKGALDAVGRVPLLDGRLLTVSVGTSQTVIPHGLGRPWSGYIVVSRSANAQVWNAPPDANSFALLVLQASAAVTVTLWVF